MQMNHICPLVHFSDSPSFPRVGQWAAYCRMQMRMDRCFSSHSWLVLSNSLCLALSLSLSDFLSYFHFLSYVFLSLSLLDCLSFFLPLPLSLQVLLHGERAMIKPSRNWSWKEGDDGERSFHNGPLLPVGIPPALHAFQADSYFVPHSFLKGSEARQAGRQKAWEHGKPCRYMFRLDPSFTAQSFMRGKTEQGSNVGTVFVLGVKSGMVRVWNVCLICLRVIKNWKRKSLCSSF